MDDRRPGISRREALAALGLVPLAAFGGVAAADTPVAAPGATAVGTPSTADDGPRPLRRDGAGRALVEATVDGHGTLVLVVDSAATRTALMPDAVERLGLPLAPGEGVRVHGTTGTTRLVQARVPALRAGGARLGAVDLPVLPRFAVPDADGLLGTDALAGCTVALDFLRGTLAISRGTRAARAGALTASHRFDGAMAVPVLVGGRRVPAIVDTGAARTLGTPALAALCSADGGGTTPRRGSIRGVDRGSASTLDCELPDIVLAHRRIVRPTVACTPMTAFAVWGLDDVPALLLGVDVLGQLASLDVDFASGRLAVT
jgi:predicted aspartyl protease